MNLNEYQVLSRRTARVFPTLADNINHAALGLASEYFEFQAEVVSLDLSKEAAYDGLREEAGDVMFYVALGCDHLGTTVAAAHQMALTDADVPGALSNPFGVFLTDAKRVWVYGRTLDDEMRERMVTALGGIIDSVIGDLVFVTGDERPDADILADILQTNIDKLSIRYAEKYTDYLAEARLDKQGLDATVS
jgi:NTP pyrophosphatase (non-canonical NTP hydrolase)